jgi:hypothetical protein
MFYISLENKNQNVETFDFNFANSIFNYCIFVKIKIGSWKTFNIIGICTLGLLVSCATNPLTEKKTLNFVSNSELFPSSFWVWNFLNANKVITGTADARREAVGTK